MTPTPRPSLRAVCTAALLLALVPLGSGAALAVPLPAVAASAVDAPTDVVTYGGDASVTVQWTPPAQDVDHYVVTTLPGGATTPAAGNVNGVLVGGLENGRSYTFTVTAVDAFGDSATSAASAPVTPFTTPGAATTVTAVAGHDGPLVSWTPPASDGGAPIRWYTVSASGGEGSETVGGDRTSVTPTGLRHGATYTFTVTASNDAGAGPASEPSNAVLFSQAPYAPYDVTATPGAGAATVSWTGSPWDGGAPVEAYTVTPSPDGRPVTVPAGQTRAVVPGLTNGRAYTFTVTASNVSGDSFASDPSAAVTPRRAPDAPTGVAATTDNGQSYVTWAAPAFDGGAPVQRYTVRVWPGGDVATVVGAGKRGAWVYGLTNRTDYTFTVTAANAAGDGTASAPSNAVRPVGSQPDARIKLSTDAGYRGNDVYGAAGSSQTVSGTIRRGTVRTILVSVQNDGPYTDSFTVRGPVSSPGFTVTYWAGTKDVTDRVPQGRWGTAPLKPGATQVLTVKVAVSRTARIGATKSLVLPTVSAGDTVLKDAVRANVKVVR